MQKREEREPSKLSVLQRGLQEYILSELKEGTDFGKVDGYSKPTLLKPGAEKICRYLELSIEYTVEHRYEDWEKSFFLYEVKVYLRQLDNGTVATEGIGSANTKEATFVQPGEYSQLNTVIKMAKKRALVDAALNVSATSGHFTQDVEDFSSTAKTRTEQPVTKKQLMKIYQLVHELQIEHEVARTMIQTTFQVGHSTKLSKSQASRFIQQLQRILDGQTHQTL